jgi:hypothetical protein
VRGRVIGDPSLFAEARVTRIQTADSSIPWSYGADIQKDGKFDMSNMWPGSITIGVYSRRNGILGWTAVTAGEEDLEGVSIEASAAPMNGAVRVEGEPEAADRRNPPMRLILTSIGAPAVITLTAAVNPDGAFTIPNAAPGLYAAEVTGLPEGSYLKTVRLSHAPTPDQNIDWRGPDSGTLELGVSTKAARLEGTLVDDDGKPAAGTVTVVPVPARPGVRRLYPTTKANAQGVFSFPSLAPGAYKVYAWEEIESSAHWDPNFILPFESRGESIEVGESGRATLSLKRISSAAMMEVLRKAGL